MMVRCIGGLVMAAALCGGASAHEVAEGSGQLGKVAFTNTCDAKVQAELQRGVAMLHSFWFGAGEQTFRHVLADDPQCTIAAWGIASILMNNPLAGAGASPKAAQAAQAAIDTARAVGAGSARERDYLEAVAAYYADFANRSERARQLARSAAFDALAARYSGDDEAQIFAALYLASTQALSDQTYAAYLKAAAVLEKQFVKYPDHPGVAHYLIHSYDAPPIAKLGLPAAQRYASIAPDAPHALHMPSHIFTRVGAWEDSVSTNRRSAEVAIKGGEIDEAYHASDYSVYAYLQLARDGQAQRLTETAMQVMGMNATRLAAPYAMAAMPARLQLERDNWRAAAQLTLNPSKDFPFCDAITLFARALGAARSGDLAAAAQDAERLAQVHKTLLDARNGYWATEVEAQRLAIAGWIALGKGQADEAQKLMRAAADLEDRNEKHIVTPGRVLPARELLGDMLVELNQPAAALAEYERSQEREPNRFRGLANAARTADAAGDKRKAAAYYTALLALAREADTELPELQRAKAYAALK